MLFFFLGYEKDQKARDVVAQINVCRPTAQINLQFFFFENQINLQFRFHIHTIFTRSLTDFTRI